MIKIESSAFFGLTHAIKYLTGWHRVLSSDNHGGSLLFYPGNPLYLVNVSILSDRNNLREEDILVTLGENHNSTSVTEKIHSQTNTIYEMCKTIPEAEFVLDLEKMKVVDRYDFTDMLPTRGLNTFFVFDNIINSNYYCMVNTASNINDKDIFAWFLSYVYATHICLAPRNRVDDYAKMFMQALAGLAVNNGRKDKVHITDLDSVLGCQIGYYEEILFPIPGDKTKRISELLAKTKRFKKGHK